MRLDLGYPLIILVRGLGARRLAPGSDRARIVPAQNARVHQAALLDGYVGVEMQHVARYLLSLDRADEVMVPLDTVTNKMTALRALPKVEFSQLKKAKNIEAILPRLVVME